MTSRATSDADVLPGTPDREGHPLAGLDVHEQRGAVGAERGSGELVPGPIDVGLAAKTVQGDVPELAIFRQSAKVVVVAVVLAEHQRAARADGDVVREVQGVAVRRLVDQGEGFVAGVVGPHLTRSVPKAAATVRTSLGRSAALGRGEVDDAVVVHLPFEAGEGRRAALTP